VTKIQVHAAVKLDLAYNTMLLNVLSPPISKLKDCEFISLRLCDFAAVYSLSESVSSSKGDGRFDWQITFVQYYHLLLELTTPEF